MEVRAARWVWLPVVVFVVGLVIVLRPNGPLVGAQPDSNAMAVDAEASTGGVVDASATHLVGGEFEASINITAAGAEWQGWQATLQYDPALLEFLPTSDLTFDTVNESWTYTGLGGTVLNATVTEVDRDGDTVHDSLYGGAVRIPGPTTVTGQVVLVRFRCLDSGVSSLHLVTVVEDPAFGATTLATGGDFVSTALADASVACSTQVPTPAPTPDLTPTPGPDMDDDGIPNESDACPDSREDLDWFEDADGCPDVDNDADGICDYWIVSASPACEGHDQCPESPEDYDGFWDSDGCPDGEGDDPDGDGLTNTDEMSTYGTDPAIPDTDFDGCGDGAEVALGSAFDPTSDGWYDVYDVPLPARPEPTQNGPKNGLVDMGDALGVLFYAFADQGAPPNVNDADYDSDKNGDTHPDGQDYDRSPGAGPDPVTGIDPAGPPNGVIDIGDVLTALAQFALDCSGSR